MTHRVFADVDTGRYLVAHSELEGFLCDDERGEAAPASEGGFAGTQLRGDRPGLRFFFGTVETLRSMRSS